MERFISLLGIALFFGLAYLLSVDRTAIRWRTVMWGFALQLCLGVFVLKVPIGFTVLSAIGEKVTQFLNFSDVGAKFVYGNNFKDVFFAFKVMSTTIFFSGFISLLYYIGVLQRIIGGIAWIMRRTLKTSGPETTSCAANIFIGQTEAPLLVRPFLNQVTLSELHAIMVGGFATVAGGVLAAYISFGISAQQLIAASVMNAPGALAMAKIFFPETGQFSYDLESEKRHQASQKSIPLEQSIQDVEDLEAEASHPDLAELERTAEDTQEFPAQPAREQEPELKLPQLASDPIGALAEGAIQGMQLALNIVAILIVFMALIAALNGLLAGLGSWLGFPADRPLSLELILAYVMAPLAFVMGVPWAECGQVGVFLGKKVIINEFIAYVDLADAIKNQMLSDRTKLIATFALCGFANFSSIGQQIGCLGSMVPARRNDIARLGLRAMVAGSFVNFVSAAIAGLLT